MVHEFRFKQLENCKTDKLRMLLVPHLDVYYGKTYINGYLNVTENFNTFYQVCVSETTRCEHYTNMFVLFYRLMDYFAAIIVIIY